MVYLAIPYYIVFCDLSGCTILYFLLWSIWLYQIILSSVVYLAVPYYIFFCGLSGCTILYCLLWSNWLYHIILSSVVYLAVPYYIVFCGLSGCTILYCLLWSVWLYHIFPQSLIKNIEHKMCSDFLYRFFQKMFLILRRIQRYFILMSVRFHVKCSYYCQILINLEFFDGVSKNFRIKNFMKIPAVAAADLCGRTDGRT